MRKGDMGLAVLVGILMQSCALNAEPNLGALKLSSVSVVTAGEVAQFLPIARKAPSDKRFLVVHFSAERNLIQYAKQHEYNILNEASLCRGGQLDASKLLQNDTYVFDRLGVVEAVRKSDPSDAGLANYDLYIAVRSVPLASGPVFEYDLQRDPQDVCVRLRGGNMVGGSFTSNTVVISKAMVAEAVH